MRVAHQVANRKGDLKIFYAAPWRWLSAIIQAAPLVQETPDAHFSISWIEETQFGALLGKGSGDSCRIGASFAQVANLACPWRQSCNSCYPYPSVTRGKKGSFPRSSNLNLLKSLGAGDGIRTHDPNLGKIMLYYPCDGPHRQWSLISPAILPVRAKRSSPLSAGQSASGAPFPVGDGNICVGFPPNVETLPASDRDNGRPNTLFCTFQVRI